MTKRKANHEVQEMRRQNAGNGYRGELRRFCSIEAEAVPDLRIPVQDHRNYMGGHETTEKMTVLEYLERRKIDGKKRIRLPGPHIRASITSDQAGGKIMRRYFELIG